MGTLFSDLCNLVHDESGTVQNGEGALLLMAGLLFGTAYYFRPVYLASLIIALFW